MTGVRSVNMKIWWTHRFRSLVS